MIVCRQKRQLSRCRRGDMTLTNFQHIQRYGFSYDAIEHWHHPLLYAPDLSIAIGIYAADSEIYNYSRNIVYMHRGRIMRHGKENQCVGIVSLFGHVPLSKYYQVWMCTHIVIAMHKLDDGIPITERRESAECSKAPSGYRYPVFGFGFGFGFDHS